MHYPKQPRGPGVSWLLSSAQLGDGTRWLSKDRCQNLIGGLRAVEVTNHQLGNLHGETHHGIPGMSRGGSEVGKDGGAPRKMGNPNIISPVAGGYLWVSYPQESQG